ncbi:MAG: hypothetical protein AAFP03_08105 [Cyanobacteria bacterium J06598_3]
MDNRSLLHGHLIAIATIFLVLSSALLLSNGVNNSSVLLSLRVSSLTTALPFLLVFAMQPMQRFQVTRKTGQWAQQHFRDLWVIAAISHLIHLAQLGLYYQLGQSCPPLIWAVTTPVWIILGLFAAISIFQPGWFSPRPRPQKALLYEVGSWYVWLVFTVAFSLGSAAHHLLFYNLPAASLFVAAAVLRWLPHKQTSAY